METPVLLVVDDEPNILKTIRRLFLDEEYDIRTAGSGKEALELLAEGLVPTVIISDQRMPGMSGAEFLAEARKKVPDSIRIVLTGYADIAAAIDAINLGGVYRYIVKPWNDDDLKLAVKEGIKRFNLEEENRILTRELQQAITDLQNLNQELDTLVQVRTEELRQKVKVLEGREMIQQMLLTVQPLEKLLREIIGVILDVTSACGGVFLQRDTGSDRLEIIVERAFFEDDFAGREDEISNLARQCLVQCVGDQAQPCAIDDSLRHLCILPLVKGENRMGALVLRTEQGKTFSDDDLQIVSGFGGQAVIGISDALLHENLDDIDSSLDDVLKAFGPE